MQIHLVSKPGEVVLDICSGSGDFTICGLALGRNMRSFEMNLDQFNTIKERIKRFPALITTPMLQPVALPPILMQIDETDSFQVENGKISNKDAKYFLNPCMMTVEPLDFGKAAWEMIGEKPANMENISAEYELCWKECSKYRVSEQS